MVAHGWLFRGDDRLHDAMACHVNGALGGALISPQPMHEIAYLLARRLAATE